MTTKHTPGPWKIEGLEPNGHTTVIVGRDMVVARVPGAPGEISRDARLIAAAPDLLEALEDVDKILYHYLDEVHPLSRKIRAAIAKARGLS